MTPKFFRRRASLAAALRARAYVRGGLNEGTARPPGKARLAADRQFAASAATAHCRCRGGKPALQLAGQIWIRIESDEID